MTYDDPNSRAFPDCFGSCGTITASETARGKGQAEIEHSIIDGLRPVLERLLRDQLQIRSVIPGVIRPVRDAKGEPVIRVTVPTANGWKAIALSAGARQELFISTSLSKTEVESLVRDALNRGLTLSI